KSILLSHGDALCTDDIEYQKFRLEVRQDAWKNSFLNQSIDKRIHLIEQLREKSEREKSTKSLQIMDVNQNAVENLLTENAFPPIFIHGHTHRPNRHKLHIGEKTCERLVLGDWYEQGSYLQIDGEGCHAHTLLA
ncbi:MAG: UDP-2,3-diacylglucosamine diphosphatase, partial [Methylophilaceae bacterium]